MLYTTYLGNLKAVPDEMEKILIVRIPPKHFKLESVPNLHHNQALSPSKRLLLETKERDDDWSFYVPRFRDEMSWREDMKAALETLKARLLAGEDICIVCYEQDHTHCHRSLLAEWFGKQGIAWQEFGHSHTDAKTAGPS